MSQAAIQKLREWRYNPLQFVKENIKVQPSSQQEEALVLFPKTKRMTIRSGHGCHAAGTIILMSDGGCKLVEDVEVGDRLMGDDGTPRNVIDLYRGEEDMYRIQYHDGTYYDVNESHILSLKACRSKNGLKKGQVVDIQLREYLEKPETFKRTCLGYKNSVDFRSIPVAIPPYILGMWLGDGWHDRPAFTTEDRDLLVAWEVYAQESNLKISYRDDGKSYYVKGKYGTNDFLDALKRYDLINNKHIPMAYMLNSRENRLALLAGLLDTDGYLDPRNERVFEITQKRKELAEDIVFICQSLGIHATVKPVIKTWQYDGALKNRDIYYRVNISRNTDIIPTILSRKRARHEDNPRGMLFGFKVIPLGKGKYYGFNIDGNNRYMLGDFTVTHNTGKDACASWIVWWFLVTRAYAKVVCTAPTARQLGDILWSELAKWHRKSTFADEFVVQKDKIFQKDSPKEWWARAVSPSAKASKEEQAETLAGFHGDHLLIVVDEASGVVDPVYIPLEGALTQEDNRVLLIGNMTKNSGYFYDTHFHSTVNQQWTKLHWDSRKSTNVTKDMVEYFKTKYGEDSNVFRIRVMGEPPLDSERTLIPLAWAIQCIGNEVAVAEDEPLYLGVDVARYGEDSSIVLPRRGLQILPWEKFTGQNTIWLGGHINMLYQEMEADGLAIDEIGVGAGVVDWLHNNQPVKPLPLLELNQRLKQLKQLQ